MEFKVGDYDYRAGRLGAFNQNHVARKLNPILMWIAQMRQEAEKEVLPSGYAQAMVAISGSIPRDDIDMAYGLCLSVVVRKNPGGTGWAPVASPGGDLMFQDIELSQLLEIIWHVLEANRLVDFFAVPSSTSLKSKGGDESNVSDSQEERTGSYAHGQRASARTTN